MMRIVQVCILLFNTALSLERGGLFYQKTSFTSIYYSVVESIPGLKYVSCVAKCLELKNCRAAVVSEGNVTGVCKLLLGNEIISTTYDVDDSTIWLKRSPANNVTVETNRQHTEETTTEPTEQPDSANEETTTMMMLMPTAEDVSCPDSFTQKASGCFYVETNSLNKKTWQGAEDYCQELRDNIHLAETNTAEKRTDIASMMTGQVKSIWVGARDRDNDNIIRYLESGDVIPDSSPLWKSGGPTHTHTSGDNTDQLDCVYMDDSGEYRLVRCDIPDYFVCEI